MTSATPILSRARCEAQELSVECQGGVGIESGTLYDGVSGGLGALVPLDVRDMT